MGLTELRQLSDKKLQKYFERHAGYYPTTPPGRGASYSIRAGAKSLFSDDTRDLREKFFKAVRDDVWPEPLK